MGDVLVGDFLGDGFGDLDLLMGDLLVEDDFFFGGFAVFFTAARGGVCGGEGNLVSSLLSSSIAG